MKLENLAIAIRPRRDWEAVDLGLLMARHWYWPMVRVWLALALPLLIPIFFLSATAINWYLFFLWLIKPLLERPLLLILSQGVFGSTPSFKEALKAAPKLALLQVLPSITWRRLSGTRSMDLAVIQLEGLKGHDRSMRLGILHRQDSAPAKWLTIIGVHLESFLGITVLLIIALLIPQETGFDFFEEELYASSVFMWLWSLIYVGVSALIAPFYVACGFSLYLNRRVKLEGWDLEIAFKRILQQRGLTVALLAAIVSLPLLALAPRPALAQDTNSEAVIELELASSQTLEEREAIRQELKTITSGEPFHVKKTQKVIKPKEQKTSDRDWNLGFLGDLFQLIAKFFQFIATFMEVLLWLIVAALVIFIATRLKRWQAFLKERGYWGSKQKAYQPQTLFGMEVTEESLPDDISADALALWREGQQRAAFALLYRASLAHLLINGVPLRDGNTEYECITVVKEYAGQLAIPKAVENYFQQLTHLWRQLAYGHIVPPEEAAQQLCQSWNQCWLGNANDA